MVECQLPKLDVAGSNPVARCEMLAKWWGDWSSLAGLLVGVAGFVVTICLLIKSKSAAEAARTAADQALAAVNRNRALVELTSAINIGREIRTLQLAKDWRIVLDRYGTFKGLLIRIKSGVENLSSRNKRSLQNCIYQAATLESTLTENVVNDTIINIDAVKMDRILGNVLEELESVAVPMTTQLGERI